VCLRSGGEDAARQPLARRRADAALPADGGDRHGFLHPVQEEPGHLQNRRLQELQNALQGKATPPFLLLFCTALRFLFFPSSCSSLLSFILFSFTLQSPPHPHPLNIQTALLHSDVSQKPRMHVCLNE